MAHGILTARAGARGVWSRIVWIFLASRVATTAIMLVSSATAPADGRHGTSATPADYAVAWDGAWYREIALNGYPTDLPRAEDGTVAQNAWAFMPVFPILARLLSALVPGAGFGSDDVWAVADAWAGCAVAISLVAGIACCRLLHALLEPRIGDSAAMAAVAFCAFGPLGALFQVAYAEALFLALLLGALLCLARRVWWPLYLLIPVMGFTRPGVLALALAIAIVGVVRLVRRRDDPLRASEVMHILATGALGTIVGFSWPVIVGAVTGEASAYLETELAWRRGWLPHADGGFVPGEGWFQAAIAWPRIWGAPVWVGFALLALLVVGALWILRSPGARQLGIESRAWTAAYLVYLALVFFPQSSTLRLLLPLAPLWGALAVRVTAARWRLVILGAGALVQAVWVIGMYGHGNTFWLVP